MSAFASWSAESILDMAAGVEDRSGTVATVLGYADAGGIRVFTGTLQEVPTTERRGDGGFGCDSIFVQAGSELTFAGMRARSWSRPTPNRTGAQGGFLAVDPTWNHGN